MGGQGKANKRERLKDMFSAAREVLKHICKDCGISYNKEFSEYAALIVDDMTDSQLVESVGKIREISRGLIERFIMSHWIDVAKEAYEPEMVDDVERDIRMMISKDVVSFYDYCAYSFNILERLNKRDPEETKMVLEEITRAAEEEPFETTVNKHSLLTRSIYEHSVFDAIQEGVKHSANAKAYVSARRGKNSVVNQSVPFAFGE